MTYARKTLSEIKLIHGDYGNFIKGQKLPNTKEKKYKEPPYKDLAASNEIDGETLNEKCWPGYEKKGMKTMFGKRYPNCVKKKKTRKEDFSDWRSELEEIEEKKMTKAQIKKRDEIADAISTKDMKDRYGDKNVKYAIATKLAMKEGVGSVVKGGLKLGSKLLKKSAPFMGGATVGGTIGYETGKEKEREKTDAMMRSAYQDQGMLLQTNSDLRKQIKDLKKKAVKEDNIQEILDKKDIPHVKKLVGKLRKGSKTHAKQADDLEKAMNEGVGNVIKKLAKTVGKKVGSGAKTLGKVADDPVKSLGMGAAAGGAGAILINQRKEINKRNRRNNPTVKENTAIESELVIQDWNSDDIKFTEIETVDIIKAKPLKENVKKKIIVKGIKALGNLSKKTKIKTISPKPVATPGTTFASGGKFAPGSFSNVSDYAGALPKPTKTGGGVYVAPIYDSGTRISPGAIKPTKGAFKGGGSLKGRIDPDTGDRVPVKDYIDIMKSKGKKYYEPVKGAKFGDKIMATKRKAFEPLKQEKLPYPKPRTPDVKKSKFKVRDDATFGDQIMVRKNEPFSRNFIGRTPMPKPLGKAKYEVGKDGATEFMGGADTFSKVNRRFADKKYNLPGLKKPAAAPKDASKLYTPKDSYYSTSKKNENILNTVKPDRKTGSSVNPEAGRVLFGKGELKTGVKKKGKTIYKENMDLEEGVKRKIIKKLVNKAIKKLGKGGKESKYSVDKALSKKIQLQSIKNQANYPSELGRQINKGTTPVKVDVSKPINFDKYFGGSPSPVKKKFGTQKPTGTFIDDLPPPEVKPLSKSQRKLMKKLNKQQMKEIENDPMSKIIKKQIEKETGTKTRKFSQKGGVTKGNENEILSNVKPKPKKPLKDHFDWRNELDEDWQKVNRKDKTDGLSKAAVKAYRRENPGSKLQTAVTTKPSKLKKGAKSAKRRLSFCRRKKGMKKKLTSAKTRRDPDSRINKALRRWNC